VNAGGPSESPRQSSSPSKVSGWVFNGLKDFDNAEEDEAVKVPTIREACIKPHILAKLSAKIKKMLNQRETQNVKRTNTIDGGLIPMDDLRLCFLEYAKRERGDDVGHLGHIGVNEFKIICGLLDLDHTEADIEKIFRAVDIDSQGRLNNKIDFHEFTKGVLRGDFLKLVIRDPTVVRPFDIPSTFDVTKTTNENYSSRKKDFYGDFTDVRSDRDYSYHVNYTKARQKWQDAVIKSVVVRTHPQIQPWIVYTCGPMGAGKGYALSWMSTMGSFPLENIVHIDPDYFKMVMSEWNMYVDASVKDPSIMAGSMCHQESGFMQEIAQEAALRNNQNIWVDGSLRDGPWFEKVFTDIRKRFPSYRIAIFYVYATEKTIRQRIKKRELETGRGVPEEELQSSLDAPDKSLGLLMPLVDFVARINNDAEIPRLAAFESVDRTGAWLSIQKRFAKTQASQVEFPNRLSPLFISRAQFPTESIILTNEMKLMLQNFSVEEGFSVEIEVEKLQAKIPEMKHLSKSAPDILTSTLSPPFPVNADSDTRLLAEVPGDAFSFAYCYGVANFGAMLKGRVSVMNASPACSFLMNGGFVYFDLKQEIVGITCVRAVPTNNLLHFGACTELTDEEAYIMDVKMSERFQVCTLPFMAEKGCTEYAFVCPGETFGSNVPNYSGGFAYRFKKGSKFRDRIFPIIAAV